MDSWILILSNRETRGLKAVGREEVPLSLVERFEVGGCPRRVLAIVLSQ